MSQKQRVERTLLVGIAIGSALACVLAALALVTGVLQEGVLVTVWIGGILGLLSSVAACRFEDDSTEDPAYLLTIIEGLRKEWQRS